MSPHLMQTATAHVNSVSSPPVMHIAASVTFALVNHSQPMVSATSAQPGLTNCSSSAWQRSLCVCVYAAGCAVAAAEHSAKTGAT